MMGGMRGERASTSYSTGNVTPSSHKFPFIVTTTMQHSGRQNIPMYYPGNTARRSSVVLMSDQRRGWWISIKTTLGQGLVHHGEVCN